MKRGTPFICEKVKLNYNVMDMFVMSVNDLELKKSILTSGLAEMCL